MKSRHSTHFLTLLALLFGVALLVGCQPVTPEVSVSDSTPAATEVATEEVATEEVATETPVVEAVAAPEEDVEIDGDDASPTQTGNPPVELAIPALSLVIPVTPMGWESTEVDGQTTTRWVVPDDAAGWAPNSARAGQVGNIVIAGHQARGAAVFAAVSLGEVEPDQEIVLADETGNTFTYRIVEVSAPIPVVGASVEDAAQAAAYAAPTAAARLTLITGWPAATTTHRVFVVAELVAE